MCISPGSDPKEKKQPPSAKSPSLKKKGRTPAKGLDSHFFLFSSLFSDGNHVSRSLDCLMFFTSLLSADSKSKTINGTKADDGSSNSEELSQSLLPQVTWSLRVSYVKMQTRIFPFDHFSTSFPSCRLHSSRLLQPQ